MFANLDSNLSHISHTFDPMHLLFKMSITNLSTSHDVMEEDILTV